MGILAFALLLCTSASAEDLARLFYTPAERDRLDLARRIGESCVEYNGEIIKAGEPLERWMNGHATTTRVAAGQDTHAVLGLRPGERLEMASLGVKDAYVVRNCPE